MNSVQNERSRNAKYKNRVDRLQPLNVIIQLTQRPSETTFQHQFLCLAGIQDRISFQRTCLEEEGITDIPRMLRKRVFHTKNISKKKKKNK